MSTYVVHGINLAVWKAPNGKPFQLRIVNSYKHFESKNIEVAGKLRASIMISGVLNCLTVVPFYRKEEIDALFNENVLKNYCEGYLYSANGDPKITMGRLSAWADILNNRISGFTMNFDYLDEVATNSPELVPAMLDECLADMQTSLEYMKIMEDWIYYNKPFMREVLKEPLSA